MLWYGRRKAIIRKMINFPPDNIFTTLMLHSLISVELCISFKECTNRHGTVQFKWQKIIKLTEKSELVGRFSCSQSLSCYSSVISSNDPWWSLVKLVVEGLYEEWVWWLWFACNQYQFTVSECICLCVFFAKALLNSP